MIFKRSCVAVVYNKYMYIYVVYNKGMREFLCVARGGGLGSRPKKMYGERLGDGVENHLMKPTPRR